MRNCERPSPWNEVFIEQIKSLSHNKIIPFECDLSAVLNNESRLAEARKWLLEKKDIGQFGLFSLSHDSSEPISGLLGTNALILRTSMLSSNSYINEFSLPVFIEKEDLSKFEPIPKSDFPSIGFVGHSSPQLHHELITKSNNELISRYGYEPTDGLEILRTPVNIGLPIRNLAMKHLASSQMVKTNFISRDTHHFGLDGDAIKNRQEFLTNLKANPYSLCIRGSGNYSIRLFETLAAGRIPILVDTDLVLPLATIVNWRKFSVFLSADEIDKLPDKISQHFNSLNKNQFIELQIQIKETWEKYFSRGNFFKQIMPILMDSIS